jgi:hypothetical protein
LAGNAIASKVSFYGDSFVKPFFWAVRAAKSARFSVWPELGVHQN